jgi:hypothetical protein
MEQKNVNVHFAISFLKERLCQMKEYDKRFIEQIHSSTVCVSHGILHISPSKMMMIKENVQEKRGWKVYEQP